MFVGVELPSSVFVSWLTRDGVRPGVQHAGIRIRNPRGTLGAVDSVPVTRGKDAASRLTGCVVDKQDYVYWARGGITIVSTDPWPRWRQVGPLVLLRQMYLRVRLTKQFIANRRMMSAHRAGIRAAQWAITVPPGHERVFQTIVQFLE